MQEGQQRLQLSGIFKDLLGRKGRYPEEVSFAVWRGPKPGVAPGERLEEDRYMLDAAIKRNSQLSLIKPLPVLSEGSGYHDSNRREVSQCLCC